MSVIPPTLDSRESPIPIPMPHFTIQRDRLGRTICEQCQWGQVFERRGGQITVLCHEAGASVRIPPDVVRCTEFDDKRLTNKYEMEKIAWVIRHDKSGQAVGFAPPKRKEE